MPHLHEKIDFTVALFIVHERKVLLVHHRKLKTWVPLGGHIELDEDPEQAALREGLEESGFEIELLGERPPVECPGTRALLAPRFLDIHRINETHEHIGMIYWARPREAHPVPRCCPEHFDLRWWGLEDFGRIDPPLSKAIDWYCRRALEEVGAAR